MLTNHFRPLRAYWDIEPLYPYRCVDIGIFTLICGVLNVVTDFVCLFLPVPMIWNMNGPFRQRIAILAMFCSGLMTCAAGVARTILVDYVLRKTYDTTWYLYPKNLATALEIDIGLVSALLTSVLLSNLSIFLYNDFLSNTLNLDLRISSGAASLVLRVFSSGTQKAQE